MYTSVYMDYLHCILDPKKCCVVVTLSVFLFYGTPRNQWFLEIEKISMNEQIRLLRRSDIITVQICFLKSYEGAKNPNNMNNLGRFHVFAIAT